MNELTSDEREDAYQLSRMFTLGLLKSKLDECKTKMKVVKEAIRLSKEMDKNVKRNKKNMR